MSQTRIFAITMASVALGFVPMLAQGATISACVQTSTGQMRIVAPGTVCARNQYLLEWNQQPAAPPPPTLAVQYVYGGMVPGTSVARAFCPAGWKVTGGGALTISGVGLSQNHPIAEPDGLIAWGSTAIGWQAAAEDWSDVQAHVICAIAQ